MEQVEFKDLGCIPYETAWKYQQTLLEQVVRTKRHNRTDGLPADERLPVRHHLIFCEHPPVFTLGRSGAPEHLLLDEAGLKARGIEFHRTNRGGDITFHGPGQVVGYPILDLDRFSPDVHRYVRQLEEAVIRTLAGYGIEGCRMDAYTGVWLPAKGWLPARKVCAIGVHLSRWVTMHGFAFNIDTDLDYFRHIIPCGIRDQDKDVTSLTRELGGPVPMEEVKQALRHHLAELFGFEYV